MRCTTQEAHGFLDILSAYFDEKHALVYHLWKQVSKVREPFQSEVEAELKSSL